MFTVNHPIWDLRIRVDCWAIKLVINLDYTLISKPAMCSPGVQRSDWSLTLQNPHFDT